MSKIAKRILAVVASAMLLVQGGLLATAEGSGTVDEKKVVIGTSFSAELATDANYAYWRIPGMIVTSEDTVITYFEARANGTDYDGIDLIAYRSEDGGDTFGSPIYLAEGREAGVTMNNPVMIPDENGVVHFLYCVNYGVCADCGAAATSSCTHGNGVFYRKSIDDGKTWSAPVNISDATDPTYHDVIATGPTHGIRTSGGVLVVPVWMVKKGKGWSLTSHGGPAGSVVVSTLYSTDNGASWQLGEIIPHDAAVINLPNETSIVETFDGRIMLNARMDGVGYRAVAYSDNGYSGWSEFTVDEALIDPTCCGSLAAYPSQDATQDDTILFVNCESSAGRSNLTIKGSTDNGATWKYRKVLATYAAGYSDVAVDSKGTIYVLFEYSSGQDCRLIRMDYDAFVADSVTALSSLQITGASETFTYDHKVAYTVAADAGAQLSIRAEAYNPDATITVGGKDYTAGNVYTHTVTIGGDPLTIVVTYGERSTTYTLTFAPKAAANSMVLHLNGEAFADQTVYGNTPTVTTGVTLDTTLSKFGNGSFAFDGSTSYLNTESTNCINPGAADFTIATWINADSVTDQHVIFWYGGTNQIWCRTNGDDLQVNIKGTGVAETTVTAADVITTDTWIHLAYTRVGTTHTLYVNGVAVVTAESAAVHDVSGFDGLTIGRARTTWYRYFDGNMDEFKVFNYALSADEISSLVASNTLAALSVGTVTGDGTVLVSVGGAAATDSVKEVAAGTVVTVTATPASGYLLMPGSLTYSVADGTTIKILNKDLSAVNFGSGDGYTYQFVMPEEPVRINAVFADTATDSFRFDTLGASAHGTDGVYDGIRFLTRIQFAAFDPSADELTVTYGGKMYTVSKIGMLLKRAENATALTLENAATHTAGATKLWNAVAYDKATSNTLKVVDYTGSYIDVQTVMMKGSTTAARTFRNRQFTACGYMVLTDANGQSLTVYTASTLTRCIKDITPPQSLTPEYGEIELEGKTPTIPDYYPGAW